VRGTGAGAARYCAAGEGCGSGKTTDDMSAFSATVNQIVTAWVARSNRANPPYFGSPAQAASDPIKVQRCWVIPAEGLDGSGSGGTIW